MEVSLHALLVPALGECESSYSRLGRLTPKYRAPLTAVCDPGVLSYLCLKFSGVFEESLSAINFLTPLFRIFADIIMNIRLSGVVLVGNMGCEMGFYLTQCNFIVLFCFSGALNVSSEKSSGVSGNKFDP